MSRQSGHIPRSGDWLKGGLATGIAAVMSVSAALPAIADELTDWGYDPQTRSLTLILPDETAPSVSVVAPTQLLIDLPDTQLGAVAELTVDDGVVESIVLEQATPDTVQMVVEFVPGTVLADSQSATLVATADDTAPGSQQWQIRPALLASSLPDTEAAQTDSAEAMGSPAALAPAADLPDLPVLESAIPTDEIVSVPPLAAAPPPPQLDPIDSPSAAAPLPPIEAARPEPVPADAVPPAAQAPPTDPPFIGEVSIAEPPVAPVVDSPAAEEIPAQAVETTPEEAVEADELVLPEASAEIAELAAPVPPAPTLTEEETADPFDEASGAAPLVDIPPDPGGAVNTSRWPDPIPFGQPLP